MIRIPVVFLCLGMLLTGNVSFAADNQTLTAQDIYDRMIHYEYDQLSLVSSVTDYRCLITETTTRPGAVQREVMDKTLYFMIPLFQLQMVGEEPVYYLDQDLVLLMLDSTDMTRERDAIINDIPCYVLTMRSNNPAYRKYFRTYYLAKDDFRRVRTISHHADDEMDDLVTQIEYTYGQFDQFRLLEQSVAETKDAASDRLIATTTAVYSEYEFNTGLDVQFFIDHVGTRTPNPPQG